VRVALSAGGLMVTVFLDFLHVFDYILMFDSAEKASNLTDVGYRPG